ncbi:unnamed protein product [Pleuronectes platessa]|uniref:Uncharacterized protein n=1 Tax=Pleuronectes platessa TaxID=8262 RepID=A0A9N7UTR4_PLEPL|nr:unnamed protein product [Pleuronectes platessa]
MEAGTLPGLFRGSHSFLSPLDNGGAVAHNQLLVCHYHAASSHALCSNWVIPPWLQKPQGCDHRGSEVGKITPPPTASLTEPCPGELSGPFPKTTPSAVRVYQRDLDCAAPSLDRYGAYSCKMTESLNAESPQLKAELQPLALTVQRRGKYNTLTGSQALVSIAGFTSAYCSAGGERFNAEAEILRVIWGQTHRSEMIIKDEQLFLSWAISANLKHHQTLMNAAVPPA